MATTAFWFSRAEPLPPRGPATTTAPPSPSTDWHSAPSRIQTPLPAASIISMAARWPPPASPSAPARTTWAAAFIFGGGTLAVSPLATQGGTAGAGSGFTVAASSATVFTTQINSGGAFIDTTGGNLIWNGVIQAGTIGNVVAPQRLPRPAPPAAVTPRPGPTRRSSPSTATARTPRPLRNSIRPAR